MGRWREMRATIVAGAVVAALLVGAAIAARAPGDAGSVAIVHDGEGNTRVVPLDTDTTVQVKTALGTNVIAVEGGRVRMVEADCPHGDCLRELPIAAPGQQIICLPHRLWVEIATGEGDGGAMDVDAVGWADDDASVDLVTR